MHNGAVCALAKATITEIRAIQHHHSIHYSQTARDFAENVVAQ